MTTTHSAATPVARARRRVVARRRLGGRRLVLVAALSALAVGGGAATAGTLAVHRQTNGVVVVDSQRLSIAYHGHRISQAQLDALNTRHLGEFCAGDVTSAEQGHAHAFDKMAQLDACSQQLVKRRKGSATAMR